jgi:predicted N-acyltransferase
MSDRASLAEAASFKVQAHSDIAGISRDWWESLTHPSIYLSYDWLRARSSMVRGQPRFFTVSDSAGRAVLAVPCYLTDNSSHPGYDLARVLEMDDIDDAAVAAFPDAAAALARLRAHVASHPQLVRPAIVASTPGLMGGVSYAPQLSRDARGAAFDAAVIAIEEQAAAESASTVGWLYFLEGADEVVDQVLRERRYTSVVMGADCYLPIVWKSIGEYFASFPGNRRNTLRQEMQACEKAGVRVEVHDASVLGPELAELELQWRHKYGRHATLSETLASYEALRNHVGRGLLVFVARLGGRAVGFTTFLDDGPVWWTRFLGLDYTAGSLFLYFNLLFYHPIQAAIARGVTCIAYSRSSYETKRRRGCSLRNFLAYARLPEDSVLRPDLTIVDNLQRRRFARIAATP